MYGKRYIALGDLYIGKGYKYVFENIDGLSSGDTRQTETFYVDTDGAEYSDIFFKPRTLKISGTILSSGESELKSLKKALIKACNPKNEIDVHYFDGTEKFYCKALNSGMPEFGKRLKDSMNFIITLTMPNFYWQTGDEINTDIYSVTPLLTSTSTYPLLMSTRIDRNNIVNDGETVSYPIIELYCDEDSNNTNTTITNYSTGEKIILNYTMTQGETIIIDMFERTVKSDINGNLINYVNRSDAFWSLQMGDNDIKVDTTYIRATMFHRNNYIGV